MCGIFGHTEFHPHAIDKSREALDTLSHRGPNQWGEWHDDHVYLGHRRLSIIDLSENGRQPMTDSNEQTVITANGEIYNFQELRKVLLMNGHEFTSKSDSEVLLHGYEEWGIEGLLERIEGMYAFVVYDKISGKIFLARDRVGIKPLYYSFLDSQFSWSSELKGVATFSRGSLRPDATALYDFLTYLYIPTPKTCYQNVFKLPPAHYIEYNLHALTLKCSRYWQLEVNETPTTIDEASERLRELIDKAVKEQLISDVPIGFFLSGGLDSSAIVAAATNVTDLVNTYSIGFDDERHDETHYADVVAKRFQTRHRKKLLTVEKGAELIDNMKMWYDEPFGDTSALPTYLVSQFAREHSTVALTGDGGDELLGGYRFYNRFDGKERIETSNSRFLKWITHYLHRRFQRRLVGKISNRIIRSLCDEMELYLFVKGGMLKEDKHEFRQQWEINDDYDDYWYSRKYWRPELPLKTRLQYLDFHTSLHDDMLTKVDRVSMSVSLETRVPLLSTEIVSFCFSLPEDIRYYNNTLKGLLKYSYRNVLPASIIERGKKGFSIPVWGDAILSNAYARQERLLELFGFSSTSINARKS